MAKKSRNANAPSKLSAAEFVPVPPTLASARAAAVGCRGCDLWKRATQTVFGEGPKRATIVLVGEQPGNDEDLAGRPFVGPAGGVLDRALESAGIARGDVYVTNIVKHFKWEARGKRRIHVRPSAREIAACRPWLDAELAIVRPRAVVCLGATAAKAIVGATFSVTRRHGEFIDSPLAPLVMATLHPSAILRQPTAVARHAAMNDLVRDFARLAAALRR
jgi:uracil-DNA glycosylase family protein